MTTTVPRTRGARVRRGLRRASLVALLLACAALAMNLHVTRGAGDRIRSLAEVPASDLIVVPGARVFADGRPYPILRDRLQTAAALFRAGKAPRILVSGWSGDETERDQVTAMREWLIGAGIPATAIVEDRHGLRTLDTMYRAKDVFEARSAVVVTNPFHLPRALFLGVCHGLEVFGVEAPYGDDYSWWTMLRLHGREAVARVRAWLDVFVLETTAETG